jgi:hypothetical protein
MEHLKWKTARAAVRAFIKTFPQADVTKSMDGGKVLKKMVAIYTFRKPSPAKDQN